MGLPMRAGMATTRLMLDVMLNWGVRAKGGVWKGSSRCLAERGGRSGQRGGVRVIRFLFSYFLHCADKSKMAERWNG